MTVGQFRQKPLRLCQRHGNGRAELMRAIGGKAALDTECRLKLCHQAIDRRDNGVDFLCLVVLRNRGQVALSACLDLVANPAYRTQRTGHAIDHRKDRHGDQKNQRRELRHHGFNDRFIAMLGRFGHLHEQITISGHTGIDANLITTAETGLKRRIKRRFRRILRPQQHVTLCITQLILHEVIEIVEITIMIVMIAVVIINIMSSVKARFGQDDNPARALMVFKIIDDKGRGPP